MNILKNSVHLIGNLGKDVQLTQYDSGSKKASVSLATSEAYKNTKGEWVNNTTWHNLIAWGKNAELMAKALTKGSKVAIQGTLNSRTYEDKEGKNRQVTEVVVNEFMKITPTTATNAAASEATLVTPF
ncbi:MAG: single-stranded DNA-binding protein [Saprospiraceae bacterium]|nr:single-stranded DNA-binding protein [Saprospiraceae bacterium]